MSMTRIVNAVQIDRPPADVFEYVTAPLNWPQWHPSSVSVDITTRRSLRIGERVREAIVVGGRPDHVLWVVREYDYPHRWVIEGRACAVGQQSLPIGSVRLDGAPRLSAICSTGSPAS